jgi:chromosome segregation ATPase
MSHELLRAAAHAQEDDLKELESLDRRIEDLERQKNSALDDWTRTSGELTTLSQAIKNAKIDRRFFKRNMEEKRQKCQADLDRRVEEHDRQKKARRIAESHKAAELESLSSGGGWPGGTNAEIDGLDQELRQLERKPLRLVAEKSALDRQRPTAPRASPVEEARRVFRDALDAIRSAREHVTRAQVALPDTMDGAQVEELLTKLINEIRDAILAGK